MAKSQTRPREEFTDRDNALLYKYIATYNPRIPGRAGKVLYENLCHPDNAHKWSFAARHPWESWQNRYKKNKGWFDKKISDYQKKKGIDPFGDIGYTRKNPGPGGRSQRDTDTDEAESSAPPTPNAKKAATIRQKVNVGSKRRRDSFEVEEVFEETTPKVKKRPQVKHRVVDSTPRPSSLPQPRPKMQKVDHVREKDRVVPMQQGEPQDTRPPTPSQDNMAPPSDMDYQGDIYPQSSDSESQKHEPTADDQESTHDEEASSEEEVTPAPIGSPAQDHTIGRNFLFESSQAKSTQDQQKVEPTWPPVRQSRNMQTSIFSHSTEQSGSLQQEPTPPASDAPEANPLHSQAFPPQPPPGQPRHSHTTRNTRPPQLHEGPYTSAFTDSLGRTRLSKTGQRSGAVPPRPSLLPNNDFATPMDADVDVDEEEVEQALRPEVSFGIFSQDPEEDEVIPGSGLADASGSGSQVDGNTSLMRHMHTPGLSEEPEAVPPVVNLGVIASKTSHEDQDEDELLYEAEEKIHDTSRIPDLVNHVALPLQPEEEETLLNAQTTHEQTSSHSHQDDEVTRLNPQIDDEDDNENEVQAKERNSWLYDNEELRQKMLAHMPNPSQKVVTEPEPSIASTEELYESGEQSSSSRVLHDLNRSYSASTMPLPSPSSKLVRKMTSQLERTRPPEPSPLKIASPPRRVSPTPRRQHTQAPVAVAEEDHVKIESPPRGSANRHDATVEEEADESSPIPSPRSRSKQRDISPEFEEADAESSPIPSHARQQSKSALKVPREDNTLRRSPSPSPPPRQPHLSHMRMTEAEDYDDDEEEVEVPVAESSRQGRARELHRRRSNVSFADEVGIESSPTRQSTSSRSRRRFSLSDPKYEKLTRRTSSRSSVFGTSVSSGSLAASTSILPRDYVPEDTSDVQMSTQADEVALSVGKDMLIRNLSLAHGFTRDVVQRMLVKCKTWDATDRKLRRMRAAAEAIAASDSDDDENEEE